MKLAGLAARIRKQGHFLASAIGAKKEQSDRDGLGQIPVLRRLCNACVGPRNETYRVKPWQLFSSEHKLQ